MALVAPLPLPASETGISNRDLCGRAARRGNRGPSARLGTPPSLALEPVPDLLHRSGTRGAPASGAKSEMPQASAARLETANGYRLTADGMFRTAKWLLERRPEGGYTTPSMLMGARCVEQSPQSTCIRLD